MGSERNEGNHSQVYVSSVMTVETPTPEVRVIRATSAVVTEGVGDGQCVSFVQAHGFSEYSGNAGTWKRYVNTTNPRAGDVVVLREGPVGHVALIESVSSQSLDLWEQNYEGPYIVSRRTIPKDYGRIVGFISPP